jgi:hypothetical protein
MNLSRVSKTLREHLEDATGKGSTPLERTKESETDRSACRFLCLLVPSPVGYSVALSLLLKMTDLTFALSVSLSPPLER